MDDVASIKDALWDDFKIEGRSAAYASHRTFKRWQLEHAPYITADNVAPGVIWNDALRLGYLLGSGRITLEQIHAAP